jgi:hypothetical protein
MSKEINKKNGGGVRRKPGRPHSGVTKEKFCVSVTKSMWDTAVGIWKMRQTKEQAFKRSRLVDRLVTAYANSGGSILEKEAAI